MVHIRLAEQMAKNKFSRADLSKITGIRYNTINDLYYEIALGVKFEHIDILCEVLNCTPGDLIEYTPTKKL